MQASLLVHGRTHEKLRQLAANSSLLAPFESLLAILFYVHLPQLKQVLVMIQSGSTQLYLLGFKQGIYIRGCQIEDNRP